MKRIPIKDIEQAFNCTLKYPLALGIDTASRTGWCIAWTDATDVCFDYGFIDIKSTDKYFRYNKMIDMFKSLIKPEYRVIIEESFYGKNVKTFQFLSRIGAICYTLAHEVKAQCHYFLSVAQARKRLGFKGNAKKDIIQAEFKAKLSNLVLDDEDVIDAMILALCGLIEEKDAA